LSLRLCLRSCCGPGLSGGLLRRSGSLLRLLHQRCQLALRLVVERLLLLDSGLGGSLLVLQVVRLGLGGALGLVELADAGVQARSESTSCCRLPEAAVR
jgi:hypothetical protein